MHLVSRFLGDGGHGTPFVMYISLGKKMPERVHLLIVCKNTGDRNISWIICSVGLSFIW